MTVTRSVVPGEWYAVLGRRRGRAPAAGRQGPGRRRLGAASTRAPGFDEVLDALISGGLRELPGFVLVSESDGDVKLVIRGAGVAELTTADGPGHHRRSADSTWVERTVTGVTGLCASGSPTATARRTSSGSGLVRVASVQQPAPAARVDDRTARRPAEPIRTRADPGARRRSRSPRRSRDRPDPEPAPSRAEPTATAPIPGTDPDPPSPATAPPGPGRDARRGGAAGLLQRRGRRRRPGGRGRAARLSLATRRRAGPAGQRARARTRRSPRPTWRSGPASAPTRARRWSPTSAPPTAPSSSSPACRPEDLQPGIAVRLDPGAIVDLGEGATIQVTTL